MERFKLVTLLIPLYNEAESIEELHRRSHAVMTKLGIPYEFITVDDGSNDGSYNILLQLREKHPNIGIIKHRRNHGKSMGLMQGFAAASGEVLITMDADLQDEPENIPGLLEKLSQGYDMVNGWRVQRLDAARKNFVSSVFNALTRKFLKVEVHDINCGFKVMRKSLYKRLELRGDLHRLIPAIAVNYGFKVTELPITHAPRKFGISKYRLLRHRGLLDIISLASTMATRLRPFHVFSEAAFFAFLASLLSFAFLAFTLFAAPHSAAISILSLFLAFTCLASIFVSILFPLIGLVLDNSLTHLNDKSWRDSLVEEALSPGIGKDAGV